MPRVALWRRRDLPVPTVWGWMLILLVAVAVSGFVIRHAYSFLALEKPAGANVLVVEGWITPEDLDQSLALIRRHDYRRVITTGGPLMNAPAFQAPSTYAVLARDYLISKGVPAASITAIPAPRSARDRTYLSAVLVRDSLAQSGQPIEAIDVFSAAVHSRRTQLLYQMAFGPSVKIGIFAARPVEYDPAAWWKTSAGAKIVIMEAISWTWTVLFFTQPPRGSREEKWGGPTVNAPTG
jgi:hypothetical protein